MARQIRSLFDRVWGKAIFTDNLDDCILWSGGHSLKRRHQRRPVVRTGRRGSPVVPVARVVCEWYHGPPPTPDHEAGHICPDGENHRCINPRHLKWQTREENEQHKGSRRGPTAM